MQITFPITRYGKISSSYFHKPMTRDQIIEKILSLQDSKGRWSYDPKVKKTKPGQGHYIPTYKSTLWTLITLADLKCNPKNSQAKQALRLILKDMYSKEYKIFTIGNRKDPGSHFPIPCLNGNILYLYFYFGRKMTKKIENVIKFFDKYQRFDEGDFGTPKGFPYLRNKSCYGKHTCFWGVAKLLKGLSFIPLAERTLESHELAKKCVDFILLHNVCYSSHKKDEFLSRGIDKLTFPNMYNADFLEILWLLKREGVYNKRMNKALKLLKSKMNKDGTWNLEKQITNLIVSIGSKNKPNEFVTERAREVTEYYKNPRM
jgi:hypothetical protein